MTKQVEYNLNTLRLGHGLLVQGFKEALITLGFTEKAKNVYVGTPSVVELAQLREDFEV